MKPRLALTHVLRIVVGALLLNWLSADGSEQQLLSNLELPRSGTTNRLNSQIGQGFLTGPDPVVLGSVRILSDGFSNMHFGIYASRAASTHWLDRSNSPNPFLPGPIFSFSDPVLIGPGFTPETFDAPGTLLTPLSGPLTAASGQVAAYVPETVITLEPNTRYFVAMTRKSSSSNELSKFRLTADIASSQSTGFSFDPHYTTKNPTTMQLIVGGWNPTGESTAAGNIQLELNKARVTRYSTAFSGGLIPAGDLVAIEAGATVSGDIDNHGILRFPSSASILVPTSISGSGVLVVDGGGSVSLTGHNTYAGNTTIANGTLRVGSGGTTGAITGSVVNNGSLVFDRSNTLTYEGAVTGTGSLTKAGSGTLHLAGPNDYEGETVVAAGVLSLDSYSAIGWSGGIAMTGGTLRFTTNNRQDYSRRFKSSPNQKFNIDTNGQAVTFASPIAGTGSVLQKHGEGTLTLTAANTYSGGTRLHAGTLVAGGSNAFGTGTVVVEGGVLDLTSRAISNQIVNKGTVVVGGSASLTHSGVISGDGQVVKQGSGLLRLSNQNTLTGPASILGGTLAISSQAALSRSSLIETAAGTTFDVGAVPGGYAVTSGQTIGGTGTVLGSVTFGRGSTLSPGLSSAASGGSMMSSADMLASSQTIAVPEPSTVGLVGVGLGFLGLGALRRKREA